MKLHVLSDFIDEDLCTPCGGKCCESYPGAAIPEDFGAPDVLLLTEKLTAAFNSNNWSVDWWEGDPIAGGSRSRAHYLRPAIKGASARFDPSFGGRCIFLKSDGCAIFNDRPSGCRGLQPGADGCYPIYGSKLEASIAWTKYEHMLVRLASTVNHL